MNILVNTADKRIVVRPDTTWERDNEDLFLPEFVDAVSWSPVLFARVSKPGRSVGLKFADRYYDSVGYGVLLYPENMIDGSEAGYASACCLDHTSFLPAPLYEKKDVGGLFTLRADGEEIFSYSEGTAAMIEKALCEATKFCYIRVGDLVAIELQSRKLLKDRKDGGSHLTGSFGMNDIIDFNIIF